MNAHCMRKRAGFAALMALGLALAGAGARAQVVYPGGGYQLGGGMYSPAYGFNSPPFAVGGNGGGYLYPPGYGNQGTYDNGYGGYPAGYYAQGYQPQTQADLYAAVTNGQIPRTSDTIDASLDKNGKLLVTWNGEPRAVSRIRVETLDKSKKVLASSTITSMPAQARMTLTNKTAYYRVVVEYINGTSTAVVSPL